MLNLKYLEYGNLVGEEYSLNPKIMNNLGINEAIIISGIISQIYQNDLAKENYFEGKYWIKKTYKKLQEEIFPLFSIQTIKRAFDKLESIGILLRKYNKENKFDRNPYVTLDFDKLNKVVFND